MLSAVRRIISSKKATTRVTITATTRVSHHTVSTAPWLTTVGIADSMISLL
jgi:hypothetical protein